MRIEEEGNMRCPHCKFTATTERRERTELGYQRFRCGRYRREFTEQQAHGSITCST
jgi:transposase-like protein